jgi:hypothetical protein
MAKILVGRIERSVLVEGDAFFGFLAGGAIEPRLPESRDQNEIVTRAAALAAGHFASAGYSTIYDGMVGPWFLPTFADATNLDGLDYVILLPSVDRCVDRVRSRDDHGFSDESAARKMHSEFVQAEIESRHVLRDPPDDPEAVADVIVAARQVRELVRDSRGA